MANNRVVGPLRPIALSRMLGLFRSVHPELSFKVSTEKGERRKREKAKGSGRSSGSVVAGTPEQPDEGALNAGRSYCDDSVFLQHSPWKEFCWLLRRCTTQGPTTFYTIQAKIYPGHEERSFSNHVGTALGPYPYFMALVGVDIKSITNVALLFLWVRVVGITES